MSTEEIRGKLMASGDSPDDAALTSEVVGIFLRLGRRERRSKLDRGVGSKPISGGLDPTEYGLSLLIL